MPVRPQSKGGHPNDYVSYYIHSLGWTKVMSLPANRRLIFQAYIVTKNSRYVNM